VISTAFIQTNYPRIVKPKGNFFKDGSRRIFWTPGFSARGWPPFGWHPGNRSPILLSATNF